MPLAKLGREEVEIDPFPTRDLCIGTFNGIDGVIIQLLVRHQPLNRRFDRGSDGRVVTGAHLCLDKLLDCGVLKSHLHAE